MPPRLLRTAFAAAAVAVAATLAASPAAAQDRTIKIYGFGAKSGVVRIFGLNSEAAMKAAAEQINKAGGVTLGDGSKAKLAIEYLDDRCNAEEGINALRRIAAQPDAFVAIGPTCSNVAEPVFGILQKKAGDASDSGLQFPLYTDVAAKGGLASISQWAFRNVPNESAMYKTLFEWIRATRPEIKTIWGGVEKDFAHSNATFNAMKGHAEKAGYEVKGTSEWLLADTSFSTQVREMRRGEADLVMISAHPFTTCGVLKEMQRQGVKPKMLVGLTSSSSLETLQGCAAQAEGIVIPTSFAPVTAEAKRAAELVGAAGASMDLHNAAAWENVYTLKDLIEKAKIMGRPDTVQADRAKMREALASVRETTGLLGKVGRTDDREAVKPFLFVRAEKGAWVVAHKPN
ncbi:ABC transporter substrate-binding protein [Piscinibacter sakaiensis]|uniref:Branched-chain amino acid ABC transporter, amino acid-binding protein n=1 Tax=Piscinibacter sakaiensis TaxID=1547922 RepID=A0A0K8NVE2_PISS1|nr:ABC transporter substrate-binding protein [Piscinibacter sakaiensis]GAP34362.1 branched-chain amino acid ABC transporter, amino acid-binding protein [Piscinibacter sakaiensis]